MTSEKVEQVYESEVGLRALVRQKSEAEVRFVCCGERRVDGHHPLCEDYVEPLPSIRQDALFE